jgi:hypothetical protein
MLQSRAAFRHPLHLDCISPCNPTSPRKRGGVKEEAARLTVRIRINQTAPARAIERPFAFGLRQTIGDRVDHGRMMAHAAMAAFDLDAFGHRGRFLSAVLPGADAVGAAEDRGGRHRRRAGERSAEARVFLLGAAAAGHLIDAPGIGRLRVQVVQKLDVGELR